MEKIDYKRKINDELIKEILDIFLKKGFEFTIRFLIAFIIFSNDLVCLLLKNKIIDEDFENLIWKIALNQMINFFFKKNQKMN